MRRLLYSGIILLSFAWFPHSLERIQHLGYDFPIYYAAAHHQFVEGWVYSDHLWILLSPLSFLRLDDAFGVWYGMAVLCWLSFARRFPALSILAVYPMLLSLELGQIAPILAWLCFYPLGAILAMCFKPYLVVFVVLHAIAFAVRTDRERGGDLAQDVRKGQLDPADPIYGGRIEGN